MWGAGQMMFNKILVLADEHTAIQDYEALARDVFKNLNPATDVIFSNGPMDVLDHSCSKLGFGGKMCIDGTSKFDEERDDRYVPASGEWALTADALKGQFPEIRSVNDQLLHKNIPCLIISLEKNRAGHVKALHKDLCRMQQMEEIKIILYVEHTVDACDLPTALWRFCNNLDPKRDSILEERPSLADTSKMFACLGLDGTRKTRELDNFQRDWPNIIVAQQDTIEAVDKKWNELGLGPFMPSPSLKFMNQMYGEEAVVSV
jgi:4-hydroxy-3-polyprenylbenzoate decarboxylase